MKNTVTLFIRKAIAERRLSLYVGGAILVLSATMMHPGFASLLTIAIVACMLVVFRWVVLMEAGVHNMPDIRRDN